MDPTTQLENFAQSIYLMIKNRYYANLANTDPNSQTFLIQTIDWLNMFIDELETEVNSDGEQIKTRQNRTQTRQKLEKN